MDKPLQIAKLPDNYPNFACMIPDTDFYAIGIRMNIKKADFDTNFCHELFHAYQMTLGFPIVKGFAKDTSKYCENLRSTILDLSANDAVKACGLTYDTVIKARHKQCKRLCSTSFKEINTMFAKDLLTIDLILNLSDFTGIQQDRILQGLKCSLPDVYDKYSQYHDVIFKQFDYHTKEGCLGIFGHIFNDLGLWSGCSILYQGKEIRTSMAFSRLIASIDQA